VLDLLLLFVIRGAPCLFVAKDTHSVVNHHQLRLPEIYLLYLITLRE